MSDINAMMSLAGQALLTQQQAINVTSHNIANVNTPGYSRQQLIMTTTWTAGGSLPLTMRIMLHLRLPRLTLNIILTL